MGMFEDPLQLVRDKLLPEPVYIDKVPPKNISEEQMSSLPFDVLLKMRDVYKDDGLFQKKVAPYEHKAFSKMLVEHNPVFWTPMLAVMTPGYQAYKAIKKDYEIEPDATPPNLKQVMESYKGIYEGLQKKSKTTTANPFYKDPFTDTTK